MLQKINKMKRLLYVILIGLCHLSNAQNSTEFPILKGDYLGQTPPGDIPIVFASGIISIDSTIEHGSPTFSPDGSEVFWQSNYRQRGKDTQIFGMTMQRTGDIWDAPKISPYTSGPVFSPDGNRLYFLPFGKDSGEENGPYYVEKKDENWSEPVCMNLITRFPEIKYAYNYSITQDGTFYFLGHAEGLGSMNDFGIYRMELNNGDYSKLELLPSSINLGDGIMNWTPFIAPDESYLLFSSNRLKPDTDFGDIYVCFHKPDGTWTEATNLGISINSNKQERFPSVSPDGKYLFFTRWVARGNEDVMWVNAEIISKIKTQVFAYLALNEKMFKAVDAGDLAKVKALIKSDSTLLDIKDQSGSTPLIRACFNYQTFGRQVEVAKFLIETGANVNVIDNRKSTALLKASVGYGPDYELIKLLVSKGADVNIQGRNGLTALHWAVKYNDPKIAKFLLASGADINISNDYNGPISASTISGTVLQVAINFSRNNDMFKFVIENGAKINIKNSQGNTELHLVTLKGNTEQAKILIEHGIDLNATNNFNKTALYYAAKHGYRGVAELLIASGADKNTIVETNYGKAKQLSESLEEGEAYIWDLSYRYAVKTKNNLLVFTLVGGIGESSESALANGFLNADELKDQKITMFLRHRGRMKLDGKKFTKLARLTTGVNMVSSFKPDFSKMKESEIPAYHLALPNESFSVDGLKVHSIPALASGMGYLVEVDGLKIFNAGLHISDDKPEHIKKFRKEIDFLKPFGPIDIVMLSVYSHSNLIGTDWEQYFYLIDQLKPKAIYLWGANVPEQYVQCAEFLKVRNIPIVYPEIKQAAGERFHYQDDKAQK